MCILFSIQRLFFCFLWDGTHDVDKFHLPRWESLSMPKYWGGWGIKHLGLFNISLFDKSLWRGLTVPFLWGKIINTKYMKWIPLSSWLRPAKFKAFSSSAVWSSLCTDLPIILCDIFWQVGRGNNIFIGLDPIVGINQ